MKRVLQWERELQRFLTEYRDTPFAWGTHDCATFASEWVRRATGQVLFTPDYTDAAGGAARMAADGGVIAQVSAVLGPPIDSATPGLVAMRGDIVLVPVPTADERTALGVVAGRWVASPGADGMVLICRSRIARARSPGAPR